MASGRFYAILLSLDYCTKIDVANGQTNEQNESKAVDERKEYCWMFVCIRMCKNKIISTVFFLPLLWFSAHREPLPFHALNRESFSRPSLVPICSTLIKLRKRSSSYRRKFHSEGRSLCLLHARTYEPFKWTKVECEMTWNRNETNRRTKKSEQGKKCTATDK